MNIESRLRLDAARLSKNPPPDLRERLQASLESIPSSASPTPAPRPVRRWFIPAVAVLTMVMMFTIVSALPVESVPFANSQTGVIQGDNDFFSQNFIGIDPPHNSSIGVQPQKSFPFAQVSIFSVLALLTGAICVKELKGRPQLLADALGVLGLLVIIALNFLL